MDKEKEPTVWLALFVFNIATLILALPEHCCNSLGEVFYYLPADAKQAGQQVGATLAVWRVIRQVRQST